MPSARLLAAFGLLTLLLPASVLVPGLLPVLLVADAALVRANATLTELTPPVKTLVTDASRVTGLLTEERVERAVNAADSAARAITKADAILDVALAMVNDMRAGKGTVGALVTRDEIYADLREMIRDLRRNPWKFFWKE
jgi:phospholipid/cholesterol/gamma-HCH transport system substrate-binding protein